MESPDWSKFDTGLKLLYSDYLMLHSANSATVRNLHPALKADAEQVHLSLEYNGELSELEAAGFQTTSSSQEGLAEGIVFYAQLAALSRHPQVLQLSYGQEMQLYLESSVTEIMARGSGRVWTVNQSTGVFTGLTGEEVIVGVIDTGIDWRHPNFLEATGDSTRILRIWDMGLVKQGTEQEPDISLLSAGPSSYGVEYNKAQIDAVWQGNAPATTIRHLDCVGHGTHVAGIAAGNGRQAVLNGRPQFEYCGVAPKAKLVIVKYLHLVQDPPSGVASALKRFKDAITYILKVAEAEGKPVVINCSFGSATGPNDGLNPNGSDGQETFLNNTFTDSTQGKICVFAAGNAAGSREHAEITIPAGGSVEIPLEIYDSRIFKEDFNRCTYNSSTRALFVELYYRPVAGINASFQTPGQPFSANVSISSAPIVDRLYDGRKTFSLFHESKSAPRGATTVTRNLIQLIINAYRDTFQTGNSYRLRISGPAGTVLQLWCSAGRGFGVRIPATVPPGVDVNDRHTIGQPGDAASVITVAAYDDTNDHLACFSSRGPLADYTGTGPVADKPDIAAPGVQIHSAHSYAARVLSSSIANSFIINGVLGTQYRAMGGTSMAAPHIAGVVALMLQRAPQTTQSQAKQFLRNAARTGPKIDVSRPLCSNPAGPAPSDPPAGPNEAGAGKVNAAASIPAIP